MWRRLSHQLRSLPLTRSNPKPLPFVVRSSTVPTSLPRSSAVISRHFSNAPAATISVDDVMPIATGHEREELQAVLTGKDVLEINYPSGPYGTKEEPAVVKSYYDKRIVGCPGVEGEDEHDVVWFWLEKWKPHECPVCSQYFVLEVVGPGGPPDGHGDHHH
ncbi:cytochrome c oxidase subunit 5b-2, mitochondrial-like [Henckelia pumila]|uniref:cytochrome c oxidase subunit 5b-2, mitochondrial-like n=1 Tax=Henckelia pumila TaxID=405737 RepID=UPI003C6DE468